MYGCFPTDFPWTTEQRRISLYPESPDKIRPQFPVFHKGARERPFMLDLNEPQDTRLAGIDPNGTVYVLAHGYIDAGDRPWVSVPITITLSINSFNYTGYHLLNCACTIYVTS